MIFYEDKSWSEIVNVYSNFWIVVPIIPKFSSFSKIDGFILYSFLSFMLFPELIWYSYFQPALSSLHIFLHFYWSASSTVCFIFKLFALPHTVYDCFRSEMFAICCKLPPFIRSFYYSILQNCIVSQMYSLFIFVWIWIFIWIFFLFEL